MAQVSLKVITSAIFGVFQIINLIFGDWMWSHVTEQEIGVLLSAILPFVLWYIPSRKDG